jgi:hypothetical protein
MARLSDDALTMHAMSAVPADPRFDEVSVRQGLHENLVSQENLVSVHFSSKNELL